jgi:putative FmdB family regulatory protein
MGLVLLKSIFYLSLDLKKSIPKLQLLKVLEREFMPLYEYSCSSCKKVFEIMQKFSDEPVKFCPECKNPVEKLISKTSFQLKGGGWYASDYKKPGAVTPIEPKTETKEVAGPSCSGGTCAKN